MIKSLSKRLFSYLNEPVYIVLLGAPGVGKGTYGKKLSKQSQMSIFSTGEYMRKMIARPDIDQHPELLEIKQIVQKGEFVSDSQVMTIVKNYLDEVKNDPENQGIIFDGIPRTLNQAKLLDELVKISIVVNFEMKHDIIIQKLLGRRVCTDCGANWNICHIDQDGYLMKPLLPEIYKETYESMIEEYSPKEVAAKLDELVITCHKEGHLEKRKDDTEEVIKRRLMKYEEETLPLIQYYREQNKLITFEPKKGIEDYEKIVNGIAKRLVDLSPHL